MGAYESPTPIIDKSSGQNLAALQGMVAKNFAMGMQGYQAKQKEIRIKKEKEDAKVDKLLKQGDNEVTQMQLSVIKTAANPGVKFKKVNWPEFWAADIKRYEFLSDSIALGTSADPSADRAEMTNIFGQVTNLTNSLGYISGTAATINESFNGNNANKPGGVYTGENAGTIEAFRIFSGQNPGSRQPRKDEGELVWDIFDGEGKLVETINPAMLQRLSELNQDAVTTISNPNKDFNEQITNSNFYNVTGVNDKGAPLFLDTDNSAGLKREFLTESYIDVKPNANGGKTYTQMFSANKDLMMTDVDFAVMAQGTTEGMFVENKNSKGALGYANTQMQNIKLTKENFINNPLFKNKYTEKNLVEGDPIGGEAYAMIMDKENDGYMFDMEGGLSAEKKDIYNLMYQKHWLNENVQAKNIKSSKPSQFTKAELNINNFKNVLKTTYVDNEKYEMNNGSVNAAKVLQDMKINDQVDNNALVDFLVVTQKSIDEQTEAFEGQYMKDFVKMPGVKFDKKGAPIMDAGQRLKMNNAKKDLVKDMQRAMDTNSVFDTRTQAVLTYDMMNAKILKKQKETLQNRQDPTYKDIDVTSDVDSKDSRNPSEDKIAFSKYMEANLNDPSRMNFMQWQANNRPTK